MLTMVERLAEYQSERLIPSNRMLNVPIAGVLLGGAERFIVIHGLYR